MDRPASLKRNSAAQDSHRESDKLLSSRAADIPVTATGRILHLWPVGIRPPVAKHRERSARFKTIISRPTRKVRRQDLAEVLVSVDPCGVLEALFDASRGTAF